MQKGGRWTSSTWSAESLTERVESTGDSDDSLACGFDAVGLRRSGGEVNDVHSKDGGALG